MLSQMFLILFLSSLIMVALCDDPCSPFFENENVVLQCCKNIHGYASAIDKEDERIFKEHKCESSDTQEDMKCYLKERGVFSGNKLNITGYTALVLGNRPQDIWGKAVQDAVKECVNKMESKKEPFFYLFYCCNLNLFTNCPKSEWTENDTCNGLKKQVIGCLSQLN